MSKWFAITIIILLIFWLSLVSLTQFKLTVAMRNYGAIIMEHETDLTGMKLRAARAIVLARPSPHSALLAPSLPPKRKGIVAVASKSGSQGTEIIPGSSCW